MVNPIQLRRGCVSACFSYRFLPPLVLRSLPRHSRNDSGNFAGRGEEDRVACGVCKHPHHRLGQSKDAGRVYKTAGAASDFENQSTQALLGDKIYAIVSLRQVDMQETTVLEAENGRAGRSQKMKLSRARAAAGLRLGRSRFGAYITKGELSQSTATGEIFLAGTRPGLQQIDRAGSTGSRNGIFTEVCCA